jgi:dCTP deaminase
MNSRHPSNTCLVSQDIRQKIAEHKIFGHSKITEYQIQPASFEPRIGKEIHTIDTESGLFRPQCDETIKKTLLEMPARQRRKSEIDIETGFELKKGFTYLLPLEERLQLESEEYIKSSPKSSFGRLFLKTRLLADFNPSFDEINSQYVKNEPLNLWLLVQPLAFNTIAYPGLSLNQLRFFDGDVAPVSRTNMLGKSGKHSLFYEKNEQGDLKPAKLIATDGLQIHLDISGRHTRGIVGLRARQNPSPIDLKRFDYDAEEFFEPLITHEHSIAIRKGEYYLFSSKEVIHMPSNLNAVLRDYSNVGLTGPLHFAGFIDNAFTGDVVFEVRSDELSSMVLDDNMPISTLDVFKTKIPDKLYGKNIGSHYQGQIGPKPSKVFKPFDFVFAAREYKKLDRKVLVQDSNILRSFRKQEFGFELMRENNVKKLLFKEIEENGFFHYRYDCETDEEALQVVPYILIFGPGKTIFSYVRAKNIQDYGDERLFGKYSIGVGGHIAAIDKPTSDRPSYIQNCIERELGEEISITGGLSQSVFVGTLFQPDKAVDKVHFGLIYKMHVGSEARQSEASIISGKMERIENLLGDSTYDKKYETWSHILIPYLNEIYEMQKGRAK